MNVEKIKILVGAITSSDGQVVDGSSLLTTGYVLDAVREVPDNEVIRFHWTNNDGLEYALAITESALDKAVVTGNKIELEDSEGEPAVIELYRFTAFDVPSIPIVKSPKP